MILDKIKSSGEMPAINIDSMELQRVAPLARPTRLKLQFWGTRGSIPVSGAANVRYGGNTSCVSLTSDTGHLFIFDCGSGARELGSYLMGIGGQGLEVGKEDAVGDGSYSVLSPQSSVLNKGLSGYILLSHTHWDHIQGFPFFGPVFRPGNRFNIVGWSNKFQNLTDILAGQMEQRYFPVSLYALPSELAFYGISSQSSETYLDGAKLTTHLLKHPLPSVAYRLELGGKAIVYATDHEPLKLPTPEVDRLLGDDVIDAKLVELAKGADILIHDAQYSSEELSEKVGWGHSSVEVAVDTAIKAGVKQLVLYHHDPAHSDNAIDALLVAARQRSTNLGYPNLNITAACDGLALDFEV